MKTFEEIREGLDQILEEEPCIYKEFYESSIQRRNKTKTEFTSRVNSLSRKLKNKSGDDKLDILGELIQVIIQYQLYGVK